VPKATPVFDPWLGQLPNDTYNGKQVLEFAGRPAFAELAVLWALNEIGWDGVWIDSYRGLYRQGYWNCEPIRQLPDVPQKLIKRIQIALGSRFGAWDLVCWRGTEMLFVECKWAGRDAIRETQVRWLAAAIDAGLCLDDFLVIEWSLAGKNFTIVPSR
jgi:hypothetical protein